MSSISDVRPTTTGHHAGQLGLLLAETTRQAQFPRPSLSGVWTHPFVVPREEGELEPGVPVLIAGVAVLLRLGGVDPPLAPRAGSRIRCRSWAQTATSMSAWFRVTRPALASRPPSRRNSQYSMPSSAKRVCNQPMVRRWLPGPAPALMAAIVAAP